MCTYNSENTLFSVDWLNVRIDVKDLDGFFMDLCLSLVDPDTGYAPLTRNMIEVRSCGGVCFYKNAYYVPACGLSSLLFCFNTDSDGKLVTEWTKEQNLAHGVLVSVSGDGCRYIEDMFPGAMLKFCEILDRYNAHCSRIDLACDFLDKNNAIVPLVQLYGQQAYDRDNASVDLNCGIHRKPGFCKLDLVFDPDSGKYETNVTVGGHASRKGTLQLYNKKVEMLQGRNRQFAKEIFAQMGVTDYWWRLEYRCKSFGDNVFRFLLKNGIISAYRYACSCFGNFVIPIYDSINIGRCPLSDDWSEYLEYLDSIIQNRTFV